MKAKHYTLLRFNGAAWMLMGIIFQVYGAMAPRKEAVMAGAMLAAAGLLFLWLHYDEVKRKL